jgi:hypothetical protein
MRSTTTKHKYINEEIEFLRLVTPGKDSYEVTKLFNNKFGTNLTRSQIIGAQKNRGITSGINREFTKGHTSWNKGTVGICKPNKTSFKKGNTPHSKLPIGTEVYTTDGYLKIKVGNPNHWLYSHKYVYMKHQGDIPKDFKVLILDQNKANLDINNLMLISKAENLILNKRKLLTNDTELSRTAVIAARLLNKTHKKSRGNKNEKQIIRFK